MPLIPDDNHRRTDVVCLVGCGAKKAAGPCEARRLYLGTPTRLALDWAERNFETWFILSAEYGLLEPKQKIEDYDKTLAGLPERERDEWSAEVGQWLTQNYGVRRKTPVVVLAGGDYLNPLRDQQRGGWLDGYTLLTPLAGLTIGRRCRWLKDNPVLTDDLLARIVKGQR
jgi:hypothetical protein